MKKLMIVLVGLMFAGCASVPPQVAQTHQKELEIIQELQKTHLAMVDVYVDQKQAEFETFYFQEYGPAYYKNWLESFAQKNGRNYEPAKDFPLLYNDLTAEYLDTIKPIEQIRSDLKDSVNTEYSNAFAAHEAVGKWLENLKKLTEAQSTAADSILSGVRPGLSLDKVDVAIKTARNTALQNIKSVKTE